ncbi:HAD hydrolase family protein, partial [Salmonella enterica subsp. enterica serovar Virginia]|nr:HAD hydrolase family protein [Salmonella enterica subsp. enterica serovar Virginia]
KQGIRCIIDSSGEALTAALALGDIELVKPNLKELSALVNRDLFGDGMNDAEMLTMAGKGCIMGNAHQRLKDLYPELEVIGINAD